MARTGVVIVTFNGSKWVRKCLDSLAASATPCDVVVVDNRSTDDTTNIVEAEYPLVRLIKLPKNVGFGVGNNAGISFLLNQGCEFILLLNQDAYVLPDSIAQLEAALDNDSGLGAVSPLHCSPDEQRIDPKTFANYLRYHASSFLCDAALGKPKLAYDVYGVNAAAWMVRASTFRSVGGFDPLFFMYGEDDDLLTRISYHRIRFGLITNTRIVHLRESPPSQTRATLWNSIAAMKRRHKASLLVRIKRPGYGLTQVVLQLLAYGLLQPLPELIVERRGLDYLSRVIAVFSLITGLAAIWRNLKATEQPGPHFLSLG